MADVVTDGSPTFWFVAGDDAPARIFVALRRTDGLAIFLRPLSGVDESSCDEVLALIIREAVLGLLEQDEMDDDGVFRRSSAWELVPVDVAPEVVPPPPHQERNEAPSESVTAREPTPHRAVLALQAGYAFELWGESQPLVHTIPFWARLRISPVLFLRLGYRLVLPYHVTSENVSVELMRHGLRLDFGLELSLGRLFLEGAVDLLFDIYRIRPEASLPLLAVVDDPLDLEVAFGASARLGVSLVRRLRLEIGIGVDFPVRRVSYVVGSVEGLKTMAHPWPARLLVIFALSVDVW